VLADFYRGVFELKTVQALLLCLLVGLSSGAFAQVPAAPLRSGVDKQYFDTSTRIQDDAFQAINGRWLATVEIPADRSNWGTTAILRDKTENQLHELIEADVAAGNAAAQSPRQQVADLYRAYMNESEIESLGLKPLSAELARVAAIANSQDLIAEIGHLNGIGLRTPLSLDVSIDPRQSDHYVVRLRQSGLGLPDRDYYLDKDDKRFSEIRTKYHTYIEKLFELSGSSPADAATSASKILDFETALANLQWKRVELRDPIKNYNRYALHDLPGLAPGIDWQRFGEASGYANKIDALVVNQPSYVEALGKLLVTTPLDDIKLYLRFSILDGFSTDLPHAFLAEHYAFRDAVLTGQTEEQARWKRAVALENDLIREALGQEYVAQNFPKSRRERIEAMVANLFAAYRQSIKTVDWMSPATRAEATKKLDHMGVKIGYPDKWTDYSTLTIDPDDLIGDVIRAQQFDYFRDIDRLGQPIDRSEWFMSPQTVNAYFSETSNEIVFPAAILQPPYFDDAAEDAINYGAIGHIIGHEISHAFDDSGSRYDEYGSLRDWWTPEDRARYEEKTKRLVAQYDAFEPVPGYHVNGALTLGENIADNAGVLIAWKAYQASLKGRSPVLDGFTGAQRYYIGFVQSTRAKTRDERQIVLLKSDPHSPNAARANGSLRNQPGFYSAFHVKPGDKLYLPPSARVVLW
jgi:predicted metalloendopeptidase